MRNNFFSLFYINCYFWLALIETIANCVFMNPFFHTTSSRDKKIISHYTISAPKKNLKKKLYIPSLIVI